MSTVTGALGLTDDFADHVSKIMRIAEIENKNWVYAWEDAFNKILPQNAMEAFYIGWVAAKMYEANQPNPLAMLASLIRKK
jgi:hypothetical protein